MKSFTIVMMILLLPVLLCCGDKKPKKDRKEKANSFAVTQSLNDDNADIDCDTSLWKYVYARERLLVIEKCKTVTGVIEESNTDEDGDQHMLLKLDKGQKELLTKKNKSKKQDDLVIEAVCVNNVTLKKVGNTCKGYINEIQIPEIGEHVKVTGSLVIDTNNGWAEIHPITKIKVIK